jgi:hypothetical protein
LSGEPGRREPIGRQFDQAGDLSIGIALEPEKRITGAYDRLARHQVLPGKCLPRHPLAQVLANGGRASDGMKRIGATT